MLTLKEFYGTGEIVNLSERAVYEELVNFINKKEFEFCQCDKCLFDIACVALNNIPSMYSSSVADRTFPSKEFKAEYSALKEKAAEEIPKAIRKVKERLHH